MPGVVFFPFLVFCLLFCSIFRAFLRQLLSYSVRRYSDDETDQSAHPGYTKVVINKGLGHLGWEILPGRSDLGPDGPDGPGHVSLGKISQARSPSQGVLRLY